MNVRRLYQGGGLNNINFNASRFNWFTDPLVELFWFVFWFCFSVYRVFSIHISALIRASNRGPAMIGFEPSMDEKKSRCQHPHRLHVSGSNIKVISFFRFRVLEKKIAYLVVVLLPLLPPTVLMLARRSKSNYSGCAIFYLLAARSSKRQILI